MQDLINTLRGVVDQFNPLSSQNLTIYFVWLFLYVFTAMAIWRSSRRSIRFFSFAINQIVSIGLLISLVNIVVPAVVLWRESLAVIGVTALIGLWTFRRRKVVKKVETGHDQAQELIHRGHQPKSMAAPQPPTVVQNSPPRKGR